MLEAARTWAEDLRAHRPDIVRIGGFGSYATGHHAPGSDFDVLIEVGGAPAARRADRADRADPYRPERFPVGMEIFVYPTNELERLRREGSSFIAEVDRTVVWLSGSPPAPNASAPTGACAPESPPIKDVQ